MISSRTDSTLVNSDRFFLGGKNYGDIWAAVTGSYVCALMSHNCLLLELSWSLNMWEMDAEYFLLILNCSVFACVWRMPTQIRHVTPGISSCRKWSLPFTMCKILRLTSPVFLRLWNLKAQWNRYVPGPTPLNSLINDNGCGEGWWWCDDNEDKKRKLRDIIGNLANLSLFA